MYKRPSPSDDEEDLLRMQEEYLKAKQTSNNEFTPAAQVTKYFNAHSPSVNNKDKKKQSKFAQKRGHKPCQEQVTSSVVMGGIQEKNNKSVPHQEEKCITGEIFDINTSIPSQLLGKIIEKNWDSFTVSKTEFDGKPSKGFPEPLKCDLSLETGVESIFAAEMKKLKNMKQNKTYEMEVEPMSVIDNSIPLNLNIPAKSYIVSSQDSDIIHKENIAKLSKMSENEILAERENLIKSLDPSIIAFIQSRRKTVDTNIKKTVTFDEKKNETILFNDQQQDESLWDSDVLTHPQLENWLNFDTLENNKLEWTKSINENKHINNDEPYEARFDFKGLLLPYSLEMDDKTKPLFHHANEPHRPGYAFSELFELSRSKVLQQRVMALNTIAGVLNYYNAGVYHGVCELPLSKILFVARFALDENSLATIEPSLHCIRNLIVNRIDEASLDALVGYTHNNTEPFLESSKKEINELETKESELNDFYISEIDLISGLQRTNILQRIYYILESMQPSFNTVQYAIQVITRLCRDSKKSMLEIVQSELMSCILTKYLPYVSLNFRFSPDIVYNGKPVLAALKLIRIIASKRDVSELLLKKHMLGDTLAFYINSGVDSTYGMKLQIEAMYTLSYLLRNNLCVDIVNSIFPVLATLLYKHIDGTDMFITTSLINCAHASAVVYIISEMWSNPAFLNLASEINVLMLQAVRKWCAQLSMSGEYSCGHLKLLTTVLNGFVRCELSSECIQVLKTCLIDISSSKLSQNLFTKIITNSNLLSEINSDDIFKLKNLINFGGTLTSPKSRVVPLLNMDSPFPFTLALMKVIKKLNCEEINESYDKLIVPYLEKISKRQLYMTTNWFSNVEIDMIYTLVEILSKQNTLTEELKELTYFLSNKLCYILWTDKYVEFKYLIDNIIFNKEYFTSDWILNMMTLSNQNIGNHLLEIKQCYINNLKIKNNNLEDGTCIEIIDPLIPIDWIYLPLIKYYSQHLEIEESVQKALLTPELVKIKENAIKCCLEWIIFNEKNSLEVCKVMNITDRFCRILCIFLCDNSLFLNEQIKNLMRNCLKIIFTKEKSSQFNLDMDLSGIPNFQDFYTQLIKQFQAVSYGDQTFSSCLLVPQAQKHNVKWRKLLWSEYAGALRALDCSEDLMCYDLNDYLYPLEQDRSLIICYHKALNSNLLRIDSLPYKIAKHHVDAFRSKEKETV